MRRLKDSDFWWAVAVCREYNASEREDRPASYETIGVQRHYVRLLNTPRSCRIG